MRDGLRTRLGIMASAVLLVLLAGCGSPGGLDGDLTDDWAAMAPATGFEPNPGTCHGANFDTVGPRSTYEEVDCKLPHRTETVFVGTYDSPAADADAPPAVGSAGARAAYATCDDQTTTYVGGPWRNARLWTGVTNPTPAAWSGGARWFRCEVLEVSSVEDGGGVVQRSGSLQSALDDDTSGLLLTCYAVQVGSAGAIQTMPAVACKAKHNAEYAGIWFADGLPYPKKDADWTRLHDGCRKVVAGYVGLPDDADLQYRTGVVSLPGGTDVWALGDHGVRCYLWLYGASLTGSLRGKGPKSLPVQYK
jgi:hypothetical protein